MRSHTTRLAVALLAFLIGVAVNAVWMTSPVSIKYAQPEKEIPTVALEEQQLRGATTHTLWEPVLFREIDERVSLAKLPPLRAVILPENDLEVRVWAGFGQVPLEGLILKRSSGQWSATRLYGINPRVGLHRPDQRQLPEPKSGWDACWQRLAKAGILTLSDAEAIQCHAHMLDGVDYVVEFNENNSYRTYMYDNPSYAKCNEAKQMLRIGKIIAAEFGLEEFNLSE